MKEGGRKPIESDLEEDRTLTLYLHGFLSHPESQKGRLLRGEHWVCGKPFFAPELYMSPKEVAAFLEKFMEERNFEELDVVGSSLGGFYAAWLRERFPVRRTVLLNPALGNWGKVDFKSGWYDVAGTGKRMFVKPSFMEELAEMLELNLSNPERCLTVLSLKDEVLDVSATRKLLSRTQVIELAEGDHRISDFEAVLEDVMAFLAEGKIRTGAH